MQNLSPKVALKFFSIKYRKPQQSDGGGGDKDGSEQDSREIKATEEMETLFKPPTMLDIKC